ncbi:inositol monophosphatase family protein [Patescibacteria group bacterium]
MEPIQLAKNTAYEAGKLLRDSFKQNGNTVSFKKHNEPVSDVDRKSSDLIIKMIQAEFPDHAIISEELEGADEMEITDQPTWIIDPLDGTTNYLAGIPVFGITVAFVVNKEIKIGIIYDPLHDEMFVAQKGKGATLNGKPIHVAKVDFKKGNVLFAGRGYKQEDKIRHGKIIFAMEKETTYFRRLGCASMMLAFLADTRADGVILTGNQPWDIFSGVLIVQEAGGKVTDYCGKPWTYQSRDLVATNGIIHDELTAITKVQHNDQGEYDPDCSP